MHERRRAAFLEIAAQEPDRCVVIDASAGPDSVEEAVTAVAFAALEQHFAAAGQDVPEA